MKLSIKFFLVFLLPLCFAMTNAHKYYVSVTTVEYNKEQRSIQIISQIFIDDFEDLLRQRFDDSIVLNDKSESNSVDTYMKRYLDDKIKILVNGKFLNFEFIGKEYKEDITYCYLEVENVSDIKTIEITNKILFDLFEDQQNILRTNINDKDKSFILISGNDKAVLNFD